MLQSSASSNFYLSIYDIGSTEHCMLGIQLLSQLTCEMNQIREKIELEFYDDVLTPVVRMRFF